MRAGEIFKASKPGVAAEGRLSITTMTMASTKDHGSLCLPEDEGSLGVDPLGLRGYGPLKTTICNIRLAIIGVFNLTATPSCLLGGLDRQNRKRRGESNKKKKKIRRRR
jgi:hypothetical protein